MGPGTEQDGDSQLPFPSAIKVRIICVRFKTDPTVCEYQPTRRLTEGEFNNETVENGGSYPVPAISPVVPDIYQQGTGNPTSAVRRMTHDQLNRLALWNANIANLSVPGYLTNCTVRKYTDTATWIRAVLERPEGLAAAESLASLSGFYSWYNSTKKLRDDDTTPLVSYKVVSDRKFTMRLPGTVGPNQAVDDNNAEALEQSYSKSMKIIDGRLPLPKTGFLAKYEGDDYERPVNTNYFWYCVTDSPFPISWRINYKMKFYE